MECQRFFEHSFRIHLLVFFIFLSQPLQPFQKRHFFTVTKSVLYHILESFMHPEQVAYNTRAERLQKKNQLFSHIFQSQFRYLWIMGTYFKEVIYFSNGLSKLTSECMSVCNLWAVVNTVQLWNSLLMVDCTKLSLFPCQQKLSPHLEPDFCHP